MTRGGLAWIVAIDVAAYGPTFAAIVANQLEPSFETALGVAYAAAAGFAFALLTTAIALIATRNRPSARPSALILAATIGAALIIMIAADAGMLSIVSAERRTP